jgi:hypothetical protein
MEVGAFRTARILCPGPSLAAAISALQGCGSDALFLGVNRAVEALACDFWVALDWKMIEDGKPKGSPKIITTEASRKRLPDANIWKVYSWHADKHRFPQDSLHWLSYSTLTAMVAAYDLGCTRIEIYGADMAGVEDWDGGQACYVNRTETRWAKERKYLDLLTDWLADKGVEVLRNAP